MRYQAGTIVSRQGLYRCGDCGEAKEFKVNEKFAKCTCSLEEGEGEVWILVEEY